MSYQIVGTWLKHPERLARARPEEYITKVAAEAKVRELVEMYGEVCGYAIVPIPDASRK